MILKPNLRNVVAVIVLMLLAPIWLTLKDAMNKKLKELEKIGKDE